MHTDFKMFKAAEHALDERVGENVDLIAIRLDGVGFSKLTRQFEKPFSDVFERAMDAAAIAVVRDIFPSALAIYVASDEISVILSPRVTALPYAGRIQKLVSVSASVASLAFLREAPETVGAPAFDARILEIEGSANIREYITWRRLDCRKNATSMAAESMYSHKQLLGVSTRDRGELLVGTAFEKIPDGTFNGRFVMRADRKWVVRPATRELAESVSTHAANVFRGSLKV